MFTDIFYILEQKLKISCVREGKNINFKTRETRCSKMLTDFQDLGLYLHDIIVCLLPTQYQFFISLSTRLVRLFLQYGYIFTVVFLLFLFWSYIFKSHFTYSISFLSSFLLFFIFYHFHLYCSSSLNLVWITFKHFDLCFGLFERCYMNKVWLT